MAACIRLENISASPSSQHVTDQPFRFVHREDEHFRSREIFLDLAGCLQAVELGHFEVKDCYLGFQLYRQPNSFTAIASLATNFPPRLGFQHSPKSFANNVMIVS